MRKGWWYHQKLKVFRNWVFIKDHTQKHCVLQRHLSRQVSDVLEHHTQCHRSHFEDLQVVYAEFCRLGLFWEADIWSSSTSLGGPLHGGGDPAEHWDLLASTETRCCKYQQAVLGACTGARCIFLQAIIHFTVQITLLCYLWEETQDIILLFLCLQCPPQAVLSHDYPYCCWASFRIKYSSVNLGWKFLTITAGPAFQWDACILLPRWPWN